MSFSGLLNQRLLIGAGEQHIAEQLRKTKTPIILVINKIDTVKREEILKSIDAYKDICDFAEIVPCSALKGDNTEDLIKVIMKYLPYGPQFYDEDTVTDQPERQIVAELIREKALRSLNEEVPHGIAVSIDQMKHATAGSLILMPPLSVNVILTKALLSANRAPCLRKSVLRPDRKSRICLERKST